MLGILLTFCMCPTLDTSHAILPTCRAPIIADVKLMLPLDRSMAAFISCKVAASTAFWEFTLTWIMQRYPVS